MKTMKYILKYKHARISLIILEDFTFYPRLFHPLRLLDKARVNMMNYVKQNVFDKDRF